MTSADTSRASVSTEFRTGALSYRIASRVDDETLRSVLRRTPMTSWISLSTEHEPCYFASANLFGQRTTIVSRKNDIVDETVGMCSFTRMGLHINGRKDFACYLGELRVLPEFRHKLGVIKNGFRSVEKFAGELIDKAHWFTSIASDNKVARRLLEANLKGMPIYRLQAELITMALSTRTARQRVHMQPARQEDIPALVEFYNRQARQYQYSPVLSEDWLRNLDGENGLQLQDFYLLKVDDSIQACFALWDQRSFKQTVVRNYRFPVNFLRLPYNLLSRLSGRVRLPAIGSCINYVFIAFLAVDKTAQAQFPGIIATALGQARLAHAELAMLGMACDNPRLKMLTTFHKETYRSYIESVRWPSRNPSPNLSVSPPAPGIVQPEIALL